MPHKPYRVLWIDDEHQDLPLIRQKASRQNIELIGVSNAEDGIYALKNDHQMYDAVLLDGLFYTDRSQTGTVEKDEGLRQVLLELQKYKLPRFILSGQDKILNEPNSVLEVFKPEKVYDKLENEQLNELWIDIKNAANQQPDTEIRHRYSKVFSAFSNQFIDPEGEETLHKILSSIHYDTESQFDYDAYLNSIRQVLEHVFRAFHKYGILHEKCITEHGVNISESAKFLSGKECRYLHVKCSNTHFPSIITNNVFNITAVTNVGSHTEGERDAAKNSLRELRRNVKSPYLTYSLTFQLMDILIWAKIYLQNNQDVEFNKSLWMDLNDGNPAEPIHTGKLERDHQGNYYCGEYLLPYKRIDGIFDIGTTLIIFKAYDNNRELTKGFYGKFAISFQSK